MPDQTPIERAHRFLQQGQSDDARRTLADILRANPKDAMAWALSARLAPDPERCAFALRQVVDLSQDNDLAEWAIRQLNLVVNRGKMDDTDPPTLGLSGGGDTLEELFRQGAQAQRQVSEPLPPPPPAPVRLSKPLPRADAPQPVSGGVGRSLRDMGAIVMIGGVLIIAAALVSDFVFQLIASTGVLPGWVGIAMIVIGGLLTAIGYLTRG